MTRTITNVEMDRRCLMARAKCAITNTMGEFVDDDGLTALEWVNVLHECQQRMVWHGLREEWREGK